MLMRRLDMVKVTCKANLELEKTKIEIYSE